jgi:hypothetical protein
MHPAYGWTHRRRRAALLPQAYGTPCPRCGELMLATQRLELDHSDPRTKDAALPGDRITHATCNRRGIHFADVTDGPAISRQW